MLTVILQRQSRGERELTNQDRKQIPLETLAGKSHYYAEVHAWCGRNFLD